MDKHKKKKQQGFTLIELLMAVAIMVILTGIIVSSLASVRAKSRDSRRISDISQIQLALEQYYNRCNNYPSTLSPVASQCSANPSGTVVLTNFIYAIPVPPPEASQAAYDYYAPSSKLDYMLHAKLEVKSDMQVDSATESYRSGNSNFNASPGTTFRCYDATNYPLEYCATSKQ
jgi:prepilin-type N-terminal cleavage/methylation domain-containing protein